MPADSANKTARQPSQDCRNPPVLPLPNLFIAGAQKSGTSTLHAWLATHPQCAMSQPKEPMFFNRSTSQQDLKAYSQIFPTRDATIIGEASTTYLSMPDVPERIATTLGHDIKFIFLLRNPTERAVSAYWHMAKRFHESRRIEDALITSAETLPAACLDEQQNIIKAECAGQIVTEQYEHSLGDRYWSYRYLRNSDYLCDIKRFEAIFGKDNLLVLLTEDLSAKPKQTVQRISQFLGIGEAFSPATYGTRHNVTRVPPQNGLTKLASNIIPKCPRLARAALQRIVSSVSRPAPRAADSVTQNIAKLFHSHNEQLSHYLRRDLSIWNLET